MIKFTKKTLSINRFQTIDGLLFVLTLWMDKVLEERENVQETFASLRFYIDNFKPITEIKPEHLDKMQRFLNQAYECHLKAGNNRDGNEEEEETGVCIQLMDVLHFIFYGVMYKQFIFRKTSEERQNVERWNRANCAWPNNN